MGLCCICGRSDGGGWVFLFLSLLGVIYVSSFLFVEDGFWWLCCWIVWERVCIW